MLCDLHCILFTTPVSDNRVFGRFSFHFIYFNGI